MTTWFVSRHPGALEWAREEGLGKVEVREHFNPVVAVAGDVVVGTLPIHLVAELGKGVRYLHLTLDVPPEARGRELSAEEMRAYGARLEEFCVTRPEGVELEQSRRRADAELAESRERLAREQEFRREEFRRDHPGETEASWRSSQRRR